MERTDKVFVAGHRGLVGSAIKRKLDALGFNNLALASHAELDLTDDRAVRAFFADTRPRYVFMAAARVGGILANTTCPADFIRENLQVQVNVIDAAREAGVEKLLFLGSSCIYPRLAPQPIPESALLSGPLEPTNAPYAIAKIAGIVMCQSYNTQYGTHFISAMPTNLYGENDNFDLTGSHVLPALIRRFHEAKVAGDASVLVWGSGSARREFLHVDDFADAAVHLMQRWAEDDGAGRIVGGENALNDIVNVGYGSDVTIRELAELVRSTVGYTGAIQWDTGKPDGMPRKLLDSSRLKASGWEPSISLRDGLARTYDWFVSHQADARL
jgi:GDP-L-fucose synthase